MTIPTLPSVTEVVRDQIYLGDLKSARCPDQLSKLGITHVVSICHESVSFASSSKIKHLKLLVQDCETEDLLIHLPEACQFVEDALEVKDGRRGKVFVHCKMGISRSSTVVAAFLMKTQKISRQDAVRYLKQNRPQVHPNYGFIKQLDVFEKCNYEPSCAHPQYRSWKRRQEQDATLYLNYIQDTVELIRDKVILNTEFPTDSTQAQCYLGDLDITHILAISPVDNMPDAKPGVHIHRVNIPDDSAESLLRVLPGICEYISQAMEKQGLLLIHSANEARACTVSCAFLMAGQRHTVRRALHVIENALPLFTPSEKLKRDLELFQAYNFKFTSTPQPPVNKSPQRPGYNAAPQQHDLKKVPTTLRSETAIEISPLSDTLSKLQVAHSASRPLGVR